MKTNIEQLVEGLIKQNQRRRKIFVSVISGSIRRELHKKEAKVKLL